MSKCIWSRGGSKKYVLERVYEDTIPFYTSEPTVNTNYCTLYSNGRIVIDEGYQWNGASGPTIDTDDTMDGSLVHDILYKLIREGRLPYSFRKQADKCIRQMCIDDGMPKWRANYWYFFLRIAGGGAARVRG